MSNPTVELTLTVMQDMELAATKTAEVIAKRMDLNRDKTELQLYNNCKFE